MIVELDSWYLPDTRSTAYRREHVKSSAVIEGIDVAGERLRYFHNAGLYELDGDDFRGVLRLDASEDDGVLPPYAELVRFDAGPALEGEDLRELAQALMREHAAYVPASNPFLRFGASLADKLPELLEGDHADYHAYAFATVRQAGSSFASCAAYLDWLFGGRAARCDGCARAHRRRLEDPLVQAGEAAPVRSRAGLRQAGGGLGRGDDGRRGPLPLSMAVQLQSWRVAAGAAGAFKAAPPGDDELEWRALGASALRQRRGGPLVPAHVRRSGPCADAPLRRPGDRVRRLSSTARRC